MKLDFRIDWGYQYLYSRRHYHPVYLWDGQLDCNGGRIEETYQLDSPGIVRMRRNSPNRSGRAARAGGFPVSVSWRMRMRMRRSI